MKFSDIFIKANDDLCDFENHVAAPYIRKTFELNFKPNKAEITICGLGFYELYINGRNITKGELAPYISNPEQIRYYDNYEISGLLDSGENVIGILLGNGMRNAFGGEVWAFDKNIGRGPVTAAFCLEASDEQNNIQIEADTSAKWHESPVTFNDIRMGYHYDSRREIDGWCNKGFDDSDWENVVIEKTPGGEAVLCKAEPVVFTKTMKPCKIEHYDSLPFAYEQPYRLKIPMENTIRENVYVFHFPENNTGVGKLKINGECGQKITIRYSDYLIDDKWFSMNNNLFYAPGVLEHALEYIQKDEFILKGGEEEIVPKFEYNGFQYAYVEGLKDYQVNEDTLTYLVMSSDLKRISDFECSDETINTLHDMAKRSDISNFIYFPNDCPHREKNGWTGDVVMSGERLMMTLTAKESLKEWYRNICAAQREDGAIPAIVPTGDWGYERYTGPVWDRVMTEIPYQIYRFTGDTSLMSEYGDNIYKHLKYLDGRRMDNGLIEMGLGEWVDPMNRWGMDNLCSPKIFTSSTGLLKLAEQAEFIFGVIGREDEREYAKKIKESVREAIRKELVDWDTVTALGASQTSQAVALEFGVFEGEEIPAAQARLVDIIKNEYLAGGAGRNTCGMLGLRYIYHALVNAGETDIAVSLITCKEAPCYGYLATLGLTTMPENMYAYGGSRNHHFLCDVSKWFVQELAGIKPNPNLIDISEFEITPHFATHLDWVKGYYDFKTGRVDVKWEKTEVDIKLSFKAPAETYGVIKLPQGFSFEDGTAEKEWRGECDFVLSVKKK